MADIDFFFKICNPNQYIKLWVIRAYLIGNWNTENMDYEPFGYTSVYRKGTEVKWSTLASRLTLYCYIYDAYIDR